MPFFKSITGRLLSSTFISNIPALPISFTEDLFHIDTWYGDGGSDRLEPIPMYPTAETTPSAGTLYTYPDFPGYTDNLIIKEYTGSGRILIRGYSSQNSEYNNCVVLEESTDFQPFTVNPDKHIRFGTSGVYDWYDACLNPNGELFALGADRINNNTNEWEAIVIKYQRDGYLTDGTPSSITYSSSSSAAWDRSIQPVNGYVDNGGTATDQWRSTRIEADTKGNLWVAGWGKENLYDSSTAGKIIRVQQSNGDITGTIQQHIKTIGHTSPLPSTDPDITTPSEIHLAYVNGDEHVVTSGTATEQSSTVTWGTSLTWSSSTSNISQGSGYRISWDHPNASNFLNFYTQASFSHKHSTDAHAKYVVYTGSAEQIISGTNTETYGYCTILDGSSSQGGDQVKSFYITDPTGNSNPGFSRVVFSGNASENYPIYILIGNILMRYQGVTTTSNTNNWAKKIDFLHDSFNSGINASLYLSMSSAGDPLLIGFCKTSENSTTGDGNYQLFVAKIPADGNNCNGLWGSHFSISDTDFPINFTNDAAPFGWSRYSGSTTIVNANEDVDDYNHSSSTSYTKTNVTKQTPSNQLLENALQLNDALYWMKTFNSGQNYFIDTKRGRSGTGSLISPSNTSTSSNSNNYLKYWSHWNYDGSDGSTFGSNFNVNNTKTQLKVIKKQENFFDIVKYDGTGVARQISHSLNQNPGMIIVKCYDIGSSSLSEADADWMVFHRSADASNSEDGYFTINQSSAIGWYDQVANDGVAADDAVWRRTIPSKSSFSVGTDSRVNANGAKYIAYIFAHDPDLNNGKVVCGYFDTDANGKASVDIGWDPQWVSLCAVDDGYWTEYNNRTGMSPFLSEEIFWSSSTVNTLTNGTGLHSNGVGFNVDLSHRSLANKRVVYVAIRYTMRNWLTEIGGYFLPFAGTTTMKLPYLRDGNENNAPTGDGIDDEPTVLNLPRFGYSRNVTNGPFDMGIWMDDSGTDMPQFGARILGNNYLLLSSNQGVTSSSDWRWDYKAGIMANRNQTSSGYSSISHMWRKAPKELDILVYEGDSSVTTGSTQTIKHGLQATPDMMWIKPLSGTGDWICYHKDLTNPNNQWLALNSNFGAQTESTVNEYPFPISPTSTEFTVGHDSTERVLGANRKYIAVLFSQEGGTFLTGKFTGPTSSTVTLSIGQDNPSFAMYKKITTDPALSSNTIAVESFSSGNDYRWDFNSPAAINNPEDGVLQRFVSSNPDNWELDHLVNNTFWGNNSTYPGTFIYALWCNKNFINEGNE